MPKEDTPLQIDMFSGELVDNRSSYQKRKDRQRQRPQQPQLFKAREVIQHDARRKPWLNNLPGYQINLEREETRTPEEIERDLLREAQALTEPMFAPQAEPTSPEPELAALPPVLLIVGLRARARAQSVPVRRRTAPVEAALSK